MLKKILFFFTIFILFVKFGHCASLYVPDQDLVYEYLSSDDGVYNAWTEWQGSAASTSGNIWRIAKNTYTGTVITHTEYAGLGEFAYSWDNRTSYFVIEYLLMESSDFFLLETNDKDHFFEKLQSKTSFANRAQGWIK